MGYEIRYGPKAAGRNAKKRGISWVPITAAIVFALVLGVQSLWPGAAEWARQRLLPDTGTREAFQQMVENVQAGEPFGDAVTAFCLEILENAELEDGA